MSKPYIPSQKEIVLEYIQQNGSINRIQAAADLGIFELSARICELEKLGFEFKKEPICGKTRLGRPFHSVKYSLAEVM